VLRKKDLRIMVHLEQHLSVCSV